MSKQLNEVRSSSEMLRALRAGVLVAGLLFAGTAMAFAQEDAAPAAPAAENPADATQPEDEADLTDVVLALERINQKLQRLMPDETRADDKGEGSGGSNFFPFRFFTGMDSLNAFLSQQGTYPAFSTIWYPFANGWGGSMRFLKLGAFSMGLQGWGGGVEVLGQRKVAAVGQGGVDQNNDGRDDYYSYASYGLSFFDLLAHFRIPLDEAGTVLAFGTAVGLGSDGYSISQNQRSLVNAVGISALVPSNGWSRMLLDLGGYVTLQIQPDPETEWFKFGINAGYNHPVAISAWKPEAGLHVSETAPPADFLPSHVWASFSFDFNF